MNATFTTKHAATLTLAIGAIALGCSGEPSQPESGEPAAPAAEGRGSGVALRVEQAERRIEVGSDVAGARASLEEAILDPSATPEQRDQARLALSRAYEASGDSEGAIRAVEELLAEHGDDHRWPMQNAAEARLRRLLTGSDEVKGRSRTEDTRQAPPLAKALAKYFPMAEAGRATEVNIFAFGGNSDVSERFGTFAIARALRDAHREACPLCDDGVSVGTHSSRVASWIGLPAVRRKLANALPVFYFDLAGGRVPARYDAELPIPSAEIAAHLERGEGLVAAKERKGAPPVILIAAPREAQLADVEEVLAEMKALPFEPVVVPVKPGLRAQEVQAIMRGGFKAFRVCYEAQLAKSPQAAGKLSIKFAIQGDGSVTGAVIDGATMSPHDEAFEQCLLAAAGGLVFPATRSRTTVSYPLAFSPGE